MNCIMTLRANRNNIQIMFGIISIVMMIMFCLFGATHTFEVICRMYFVLLNSTSNNRIGFNFIWILPVIFSCSFCMNTPAIFTNSVLLGLFWIKCSIFSGVHFILMFAFFGLTIFLVVFFVVCTVTFSLLVWSCTYFAKTCIAIFTTTVFVKSRDRFSVLTTRTSLSSNHVSFLNKLLNVFEYSTNQTLCQGELL